MKLSQILSIFLPFRGGVETAETKPGGLSALASGREAISALASGREAISASISRVAP